MPNPFETSGAPATTKELIPKEHGEAEHKKVSSSFAIFLIVVLIVMLFVTGVFIANAIYFDDIRNKGGCANSISKNEANIMFWLNVILAVVSGIMIIVCIALLFLAYRAPKFTEKYIGTVQAGTAVQPYVQEVAGGVGRGAQEVAGGIGRGAQEVYRGVQPVGRGVYSAGRAGATRLARAGQYGAAGVGRGLAGN